MICRFVECRDFSEWVRLEPKPLIPNDEERNQEELFPCVRERMNQQRGRGKEKEGHYLSLPLLTILEIKSILVLIVNMQLLKRSRKSVRQQFMSSKWKMKKETNRPSV